MMKYIASLLFFVAIAFGTNAQTFTNYTTADGLSSDNVHCLDIDDSGNIWFGTQQGISMFDGTNWTVMNTTTDTGLVDNNITAILVDNFGNIWAGTDFGVSVYDGSTWTTYDDNNGLGDNRVKYLERSGTGATVFVGHSDGLSWWNGSIFQNYDQSSGLPFGGISYVVNDPNSSDLWLGTGLGGVAIFDGMDFTLIDETNGLLNDRVTGIAIDAFSNKWVSTVDGISVLDDQNLVSGHHEYIFELPPPDSLNPVEDVKIDSRGIIWAGVYVDYLVTVGGVSYYNGNTWEDIDQSDGLVGPVVRRLAIDADDNVWVATGSGVSKISDVQVDTSFVGVEGIEENIDISIYPNPSNGKITIFHSSETSEEFVLRDAQGRMVEAFLLKEERTTLNLSNYSPGMYFGQVGSNVRPVIITD